MESPPVVVVGIGGAGCRMLSAVNRFAQAENLSDEHLLLAIDSNRRNLTEIPPASAHCYRLDIDRQSTVSADEIEYLDRQPDFVPTAGTARYRPFGRYLVDSATDKTRLTTFFEDTISSFLQESQTSKDTPLQVWLLNSLSGGTGSGAMPLLVLLLHDVCHTFERPIEYYGLGSLPRLDELERGIEAPSGEPVHYVNAYTALAEIAGLLADKEETPTARKVQIDASAANIRTKSITIDESPFESYWLLGVPEDDQLSLDCYDRLNQIPPRLIQYVRMRPDRTWLKQRQLYSVAGVGVSLPQKTLAEYTDVTEKLKSVETELTAVREQRAALRTAATRVQSVTDFDTATASEVLSSPSPVDRIATQLSYDEGFLRECYTVVADSDDIFNTEYTADGWLNDVSQALVATYEDQFTEGVPVETVTKQILAVLALARVRNVLSDHRMPQTLTQLYEQWCADDEATEQGIDPDRNEETISGPVSEWYPTVMECLERRNAELEQEAEGSSMPAPFSMAEQQLEAIEDDYTRAQRLVQEYEQLSRFERGLEKVQTDLREQLRESEQELRQQSARRQDEWESQQRTWTQLSRQQSRLKESLSESRWEGGELKFPITSAYLEQESEEPSEIEDINSISHALEVGALDTQILIETLRTAVGTLGEPIEDLAETDSRFAMTEGHLGVLAPGQEINQLSSLLTGETATATEQLTKELDYHFHRYDQFVPWQREGGIYLLGIYTPVSLGSTSEFQTVNEYYTDHDRDVADLFGSISDSDVSQRFAYPELLPPTVQRSE